MDDLRDLFEKQKQQATEEAVKERGDGPTGGADKEDQDDSPTGATGGATAASITVHRWECSWKEKY